MLVKSLKTISNLYNLLLSLGAFYSGMMMLLGTGSFASFPQEWLGKVPFNNWIIVAFFTILLFGIGNAVASLYGFMKRENQVFIITIIMGSLFFLCIVTQIILLKEWYLATVEFLFLSVIQIFIGSFGLVTKNRKIEIR